MNYSFDLEEVTKEVYLSISFYEDIVKVYNIHLEKLYRHGNLTKMKKYTHRKGLNEE